MGISIWVPIYGYLYMGTSIWVPLYGYLYMGTYIWVPLYGYLYMGTYIWVPLYGYLYMGGTSLLFKKVLHNSTFMHNLYNTYDQVRYHIKL